MINTDATAYISMSLQSACRAACIMAQLTGWPCLPGKICTSHATHVSLTCSPSPWLPWKSAHQRTCNSPRACLQISSVMGSTSFARKPHSEVPLNQMWPAYWSSKAALNMQVGPGLVQRQLLRPEQHPLCSLGTSAGRQPGAAHLHCLQPSALMSKAVVAVPQQYVIPPPVPTGGRSFK